MKYKVNLRGGETVEVETTPPTPPMPRSYFDNTLLYAKMGTLAVEGVRCEKYREHSFDGTLATCLVMYRWKDSVMQTNSPLCSEHARELIDYLAQSLPPSGNTGVTNSQVREEKPE